MEPLLEPRNFVLTELKAFEVSTFCPTSPIESTRCAVHRERDGLSLRIDATAGKHMSSSTFQRENDERREHKED